MKILVTIKATPDPGVRAHAAPDGRGVLTAGAKLVLNSFDEVALEAAVRLRESGRADEVVALNCADGETEPVARAALAMGADRALVVRSERPLWSAAAARLIAAVAAREKPDLILSGKQATDDDEGLAPAMVSAFLGWPLAVNVSRLELADGQAHAWSETDDSLVELAAALPAVVTVDLRLAEPRYLTLPMMMRARRQPIEALSAAELVPDLGAAPEIISLSDAPERGAGRVVASLDELQAILRDRLKLL